MEKAKAAVSEFMYVNIVNLRQHLDWYFELLKVRN